MNDIILEWNNQDISIESTVTHSVGEKVGIKWNPNDVHFIPNTKG
jgi:hypothetical protein